VTDLCVYILKGRISGFRFSKVNMYKCEYLEMKGILSRSTVDGILYVKKDGSWLNY
jgi:hypothetical protein